MHTPEDDRRLRELLQAWNEMPAPDLELARRVQSAAVSTPGAQPAATLVGFTGWFRLAGVGIAAGVLLGMGAAEWQRRRPIADAPSHYLQWIDPQARPGDIAAHP